MMCVCGTRFCYDCGQPSCKCMYCQWCPGVLTHSTEDCPYGPFCKHCDTRGHMVQDCPKMPQCTGCGRKGHRVKACTVTCTHCRTKGHVRAKCPKLADAACWTCGTSGHMRSSCPAGSARQSSAKSRLNLADESEFPSLGVAAVDRASAREPAWRVSSFS